VVVVKMPRGRSLWAHNADLWARESGILASSLKAVASWWVWEGWVVGAVGGCGLIESRWRVQEAGYGILMEKTVNE
jgi:hypothetical protein